MAQARQSSRKERGFVVSKRSSPFLIPLYSGIIDTHTKNACIQCIQLDEFGQKHTPMTAPPQ